MKGKLHKSMNYGWMVQHEHSGIDNISFYPLHPYDTITNKIERFEGKEVDFVLEDFWETGLEEKLIKVAIIEADITDYSKEEDTPKEVGFLGYSTKKILKELYPDAYSILGEVLFREKSDLKNTKYGLISLEILEKEIKYNEIMLNKPISNKDFISGRLEAFNFIKDNIGLKDEFLKNVGGD